jgi:predicted dehydrogenase
MGLRIGVVGAGNFYRRFVPLFQAHPLVDEVCLAEVDPERRHRAAARFGIGRTFASLDEVCRSDVDAVALFTQRWRHGPQAVQALSAGKHVYSAVPAAITLEEMADLVEAAGRTGLIYMMGETSYYYPAAIYCRERFRAGDFGRFVYGEAEYLHDMSKFVAAYDRTNGEGWRAIASFPPMLYATHTLALVLSVTDAHVDQVSCLGIADDHADGIFREEISAWGNVFSNEVALFRTSDGGACRINEFRRTGISGEPHVRVSIYGTDASYEEQIGFRAWVTRDPADFTDLRERFACTGVRLDPNGKPEALSAPTDDGFLGLSVVHPAERLPAEYRGIENGHEGGHPFLADDFVRACVSGQQPILDVYTAARYTVPGIVAHASAQRGGELMNVPDFGGSPTHRDVGATAVA